MTVLFLQWEFTYLKRGPSYWRRCWIVFLLTCEPLQRVVIGGYYCVRAISWCNESSGTNLGPDHRLQLWSKKASEQLWPRELSNETQILWCRMFYFRKHQNIFVFFSQFSLWDDTCLSNPTSCKTRSVYPAESIPWMLLRCDTWSPFY